MPSNRLNQAIQAIHNHDLKTARSLILQEVKENPDHLAAWVWAMEVAANDQEKRTILKRILKLDPDHRGAKKFLAELDSRASSDADLPLTNSAESDLKPSSKKKSNRWFSLILLPLQWLSSLPLSCGLLFLLTISLVGGLIYFRSNTSFFGFVGTDFDQLEISNAYQDIALEDQYWKVQFENSNESKYIGTVRHVSPIRMNEFKILTHDILVTSADFANPELVDTQVINHKFIWQSKSQEKPNGYIYLLHAVPANQEIYQQLVQIKKWDIVRITGREIYQIKSFDNNQNPLGTWQDAGCNTILVETVTILRQ